MCSRINVPQLSDFSKKVKKKRVRSFKPPDDEAGDAYCNSAAGVESGYKMTKIKGAGRGNRRFYCTGTEPENKDADFRAAYQTKCMKSKRFKDTMGKQGKCKDTFTTSKVFKSNCAGKARRAMCEPEDYDMSVYPVKVQPQGCDTAEIEAAKATLARCNATGGDSADSEEEPEEAQSDSDDGNW